MLRTNKIDINALKFGILMNFSRFVGEEKAKEAASIVDSLEEEINEYREVLEEANSFMKTFMPTNLMSKKIDKLLGECEG